jgi:hypothetical protein
MSKKVFRNTIQFSKSYKTYLIPVFFLGIIFLTFLSIHSNEPLGTSSSSGKCSQAKESFAVVELFTSQGCSSCPPADKVLAELSQIHPKKNIFPLSFHVTYWDYIGWKDPYGNKEFSKRQERYANAIDSRLYTPQAVLNGSKDFVGSNRSTILHAVDSVLASQSSVSINLKSKITDSSLDISYTIHCSSENFDLNLALVEKGITNSVKRGENSGKTLSHENVVREFQTLSKAKKNGSTHINWNFKGKDLSQFTLIGYLQDPQSMKILAANSLSLK